MKSSTDYDKAIEITGAVVNDWDPYSLLANGALAGEFDNEIARLVVYIPQIADTSDAVRALSVVFSEAFEPKLFTPESCSEAGESWFKALSQAGLV